MTEMILLKDHLMEKDLTFKRDFCMKEEGRSLCDLSIKLRRRGVLTSLCEFDQEELLYLWKRSYLFELECLGVLKVFNQKAHYFF